MLFIKSRLLISNMKSNDLQGNLERGNWDHTAPHAYFSLPLSPQVYRAIALLLAHLPSRKIFARAFMLPEKPSLFSLQNSFFLASGRERERGLNRIPPICPPQSAMLTAILEDGGVCWRWCSNWCGEGGSGALLCWCRRRGIKHLKAFLFTGLNSFMFWVPAV